MKRSLFALLLCIGFLTACSNSASPTATTDTPTQAPVAGAETDRNERGNIVKSFGDHVVIIQPDTMDKVAVDFVVGAPSEQVACLSRLAKPENGKFISLPISVTTSDVPQEFLGLITFGGQTWEYISADGTSINPATTASFGCRYENPGLRPSRKYNFVVVLDVPTTTTGGLITYRVPSSGLSWEWKL